MSTVAHIHEEDHGHHHKDVHDEVHLQSRSQMIAGNISFRFVYGNCGIAMSLLLEFN